MEELTNRLWEYALILLIVCGVLALINAIIALLSLLKELL